MSPIAGCLFIHHKKPSKPSSIFLSENPRLSVVIPEQNTQKSEYYRPFTRILDWTKYDCNHYVSQMNMTQEFERLVRIVAQLRGPGGCPWDQEQTAKSLTPYIIEEAHELVDAIESENTKEVIEELGDYLFQVILQAQVAADQNRFDLADVLRVLNDKMIRRHPHVFASAEPGRINSKKVLENWDEIKRNEKPDSIFRLPKNLPALQYAHKLGAKSARWKFDWSHEAAVPTALRVLDKVDEELEELKEALETWLKKVSTESKEPFHQVMDAKNPEALHLVHEMGDLLFALAQLARHLGFQAEDSLRGCNHRFENRFETMLDIGKHNQESFLKLNGEEMEELWLRAKALTKGKESHGKE